jgi:DNA (cytosine-5)-methyltransferase 3A
MKILSLFDGISCTRVALERAGIPVELYYASEVDKYAIQIAQKNYPDTLQVGSVVDLQGHLITQIDLLIGGSPCQDLSIAKKNRKGLSGERSGLFWEYVRILKEVKPKWFILENVNSMPKEAKDLITKTLGVEPIMINAALVSAQNRKRLFWTNIPNVTQPKDRGILLKDILENGETERIKSYAIDANYFKGGKIGGTHQSSKRLMVRVGHLNSGGQGDRIYSPNGKSVGLSALGGGIGAKTGLYMIQTPRGYNKGGNKALDGKTPTLSSSAWEHNNKLVENSIIRKLTPIECERLQGLPDGYTDGISNTQRYKCLGNAFNVDVVAHILSFIPN